MTPLRRLLPALTLACALSFSAHSTAQTAEPVLKGKDVTTEALIDALAPGAGSASRTRGFKPVAADTATPAAGGRASLLITFHTNSTQLTADAQRMVATLAKAMQSDALTSARFKVQGHADARGNAQANLALSQARAEAVAAQLTRRHGIAAERLLAEGRGSAEPYDIDRVDAPENRRVTIINLR